jgi:hypothetical protein
MIKNNLSLKNKDSQVILGSTNYTGAIWFKQAQYIYTLKNMYKPVTTLQLLIF